MWLEHGSPFIIVEIQCILENGLPNCEKLQRYCDHIGYDFEDFGCYSRNVTLATMYENDELKQKVYTKMLQDDCDLSGGAHEVSVSAHTGSEPISITVKMEKAGDVRYRLLMPLHTLNVNFCL